MTAYPDAAASQRSWVEIDLGALKRNADRIHAHAGRPLIAVVKADAYGHGARQVAESLARWGSNSGKLHAFGTATLAEAIELRAVLSSNVDIMCCTPLLREELAEAKEHTIIPSLHRAADIGHWSALGGETWHLSIDTGMQRAGVRWDSVHDLVNVVRDHPPSGVFTHFHSAEKRDGSRELQEERFESACEVLGLPPTVATHTDNSAAIAARGPSSATFVRPGLALYGGACGPELPVEPVASIRARITDIHNVRDGESVSYDATWRASGARTIATLGIGHADGYRQAFGNRAHVLVHGKRAPVVGVVTMDLVMVDVTDIVCNVGDVVTLLGHDGNDFISPEELAAHGGLSVYELLIGLRLRMPHLNIETPSSTKP